MQKRIYVQHGDKITHRENNLVNLTCQNGEFYEKLEPRRLFPISYPELYIALLSENGCEVGIIKDPSCLDGESQRVINDSLDYYYLVPAITKILSVSEKYGTLHWSVMTDRGAKEFDIRNRNHDIRVYKDFSVLIRDADDNRYIIKDHRTLDEKSLKSIAPDL